MFLKSSPKISLHTRNIESFTYSVEMELSKKIYFEKYVLNYKS